MVGMLLLRATNLFVLIYSCVCCDAVEWQYCVIRCFVEMHFCFFYCRRLQKRQLVIWLAQTNAKPVFACAELSFLCSLICVRIYICV